MKFCYQVFLRNSFRRVECCDFHCFLMPSQLCVDCRTYTITRVTKDRALGRETWSKNSRQSSSGGAKGWSCVGHAPQMFGWPLLGPSVFCLISNSFDWYIQQITFSQQNFKRFETFLAAVLTIFTSLQYVGFISMFITTENHHEGETFMLASLLFSLAPKCPPVFFILESSLQSFPISSPQMEAPRYDRYGSGEANGDREECFYSC